MAGPTREVYYLSATMTEFLVSFNCCIGDQPQPKRHPRLDGNMIGQPMNFVHITHIGTSEMSSSCSPVRKIQEQMKSKGGYNSNTQVSEMLEAEKEVPFQKSLKADQALSLA